jgi:hypothetical protein
MADSRVLAPPRWPIVALNLGLVVLVGFIATAVPVSNKSGYATYAGYAVFLGAILWFAFCVASARVVGSRAELRVIQPFWIVHVVTSDVRGVTGDNGVVISTFSGGDVEVLAYGSSLWQRFFKSRKYASSAARIAAWVAAAAGARNEAPVLRDIEYRTREEYRRHAPHLRRTIRWSTLAALPVALAVAQLYGLVVWLAT